MKFKLMTAGFKRHDMLLGTVGRGNPPIRKIGEVHYDAYRERGILRIQRPCYRTRFFFLTLVLHSTL